MSDGEELAAPMRAMVVMDRNLDNPAAAILESPHHLHADHATIASELDLLEETSAEEAKIAVDIPDMQPEQ